MVGCAAFAAPAGTSMTRSTELHPLLRWGVLLWLLVWLPVNVQAWGWRNMMHFCDVGAIIACLGIFMRIPLLFSSQAVGSLFVGVLWGLDIAWRLVTGHHLVGGTEYMWDEHYALWIRLLSTFHIALPLVLLWAMRKMGYDPRALALQSAIAAVLLIFSRFLSPALNMNYAFQDPLFHRAWGPAPVHLAVIFAGTVAVLYWPTHALLGKIFAVPAQARLLAE
jgi:hypothetical protein